MKKKILFIALLIILCFTACSTPETADEGENIVETEEQEPFVIVYHKKFTYNGYVKDIYIWVDTTTGVMYMEAGNGGGRGTVMLTNPDGTPRLYQGEFD